MFIGGVSEGSNLRATCAGLDCVAYTYPKSIQKIEFHHFNIRRTPPKTLLTLVMDRLFGYQFARRTYEKRRGREWSRREPSDIDEARKGELAGGERINRTGA
jgi:hypothetical protein